MRATVNVTVNGERREIASDSTVKSLLDSLGLAPQATVVQKNNDILDRARFADTLLAEGDALELVRFVGGG
ncbi:MAG: sulfur carrier protein ThiS [Candidatus Hydrogenedentes bacterium]|nr:sulfur carrier protein ThiS [Candidatus Hydrogenedentota bacterium]